MSRREYVRLSFERGLESYAEDTQLPAGAALALQNWVPEANGSLRARPGWLAGSTTGLGATRRGRGFGYFVPSAGARLLCAEDDGTASYRVRWIPFASLASGSWTQVEAIAVATRTAPVAFASGAGKVLYTHPSFPNSRIRAWDGTTASDASAEAVAGRALLYHKSRFFSGGPAANPSRLHYCELGDPSTWNFSSETNQIDVSEDDGEPIEDLASFDNGLVIGKASSLHFLSGAGPDTFQLHPLGTGGRGGIAPGRTLVPTPVGVIAIGPKVIWLWAGGNPQPISAPIQGSYAITGAFASGAYVDGRVYVCDNATGALWVWDVATRAWCTELSGTAAEGPGLLAAQNETLLAGTKDAAAASILAYRTHPNPTRARDAQGSETFLARTGKLWLGGSSSPATLRGIYARFRQRGGGPEEPPLKVIAYFDGVEAGRYDVLQREGGGVFREFLDLAGTGYALQLEASHAVTAGDLGVLDVEELLADIELENMR